MAVKAVKVVIRMGFKKIHEGSRKFMKVHEGSRRFKKVQEGN